MQDEKEYVPQISVIMPVYNERECIERAIESIINQSMKDFEFIIINDIGSDDGTADIVRDYAVRDSRIKLIQKERGNQGIAASLNLGLKNAVGKYIARMDADDWSYPDRLEMQLNYMNEHPEIVMSGTAFRMVGKGNPQTIEMEVDPEINKCKLLFGSVVAHPTVIFRRNFFLDNGLWYDENEVVEDYELWCRVAHIGKISNLTQVLLDYSFGSGKNVSAIENTDFQKKAVSLRIRNINDWLKLDMHKFPWEVFACENYPISNAASYIKDYLNLLLEIDKANGKYHIYDDRALSVVLAEKWNWFLRSVARVGALASRYNVFSNVDKNNNFTNQLLKLYGAEEKIMLAVEQASRELCFTKNNLKNVFIWGTGIVMERYIKLYPVLLNKIVIGYIDNDESKYGSVWHDRLVYPPQQLKNAEYDAIIISSSKYYDEIRGQLQSQFGIDSGKIYPISILDF